MKNKFSRMSCVLMLSVVAAVILTMMKSNHMMAGTTKPLFKICVPKKMQVESSDCSGMSRVIVVPVSSLCLYGARDFQLKYMEDSGPSHEWGYGLTRVWGSLPDSLALQRSRLFDNLPKGEIRVTHWHGIYKSIELQAGPDGKCHLADDLLFNIILYATTNLAAQGESHSRWSEM